MLCLIVLLLAAFPVQAQKQEECPAADRTKVPDLLRNAPSCERSMKVFEACAYGASGDVELGAAVVERCEQDFLSKLSRKQKASYDRDQKRCARKYVKKSGTMYRSFEAFCSVEVARKLARRHGKAPGGTKAK